MPKKKTLACKIGKKKFLFKDMSWMTVQEFHDFMEAQELYEKLSNEVDEMLDLAETMDLNNEQLLELQDKQHKQYLCRIKQLVCYSTDPKKLTKYLLNTLGVTHVLINDILSTVVNEFGTVEDMINKCTPKHKFFIHRLGSFYKKAYYVYGLEYTSVVREYFALTVANQINVELDGVVKGNWLNLASFVACIAREKSQMHEREIAKGHDIIDRYNDYARMLQQQMEYRQELFKNMNISDAISIFKFFFQAREKLASQYTKLYGDDPKAQETEAYLQRFGIEVSIEDLRRSSGYRSEDILLFPVKQFHEEMLKQHMRTKSVIAEQKQ